MEKKFKRTLVTAALPYANGPLHIGHLAGVYVPADIYVRYLRLKGREVLFVCGSDEHGVPITIKARQSGCSPQDIVDKYNKIIYDSFKGFGIDFDIYGRTSSEIHAETASDFFLKLYKDGKFVTQTTEQYFDPEANVFLADRYIVGTCPRCGNPDAYGDQCERCGSTLSPEELINPHSKLSGATPVKKKTTHWYLPLQDYEQWLREWILEGHKEWRPNVYGQVKSWLDGGLKPRAVTRDLDWGVPVPLEGAEGKVLYVWFDAPIGYISNTRQLLPDSWEKWWKSEDTRLIHFIGKDNIVFHCIVFPSMLKAYGDGYILPDNVPANEFLNLEGEKISTSRGWAVWADEYLKDFPGKADTLRYVLTANAPETKDNDFSWKDFQTRNNSELVGIFGNFVNRAFVLTHKYFEGKVPPRGELSAADRLTLDALPQLRESLEENLEGFHFRDALRDAMNIARLGNKYISDSEPWKLAKTDLPRTGTILNVCLQICANLSIAFSPFTPFAADKLASMLDFTPSWDLLGGADLLLEGHPLRPAELLFDKIDDAQISEQLSKLEASRAARLAAEKANAPAASAEPLKEQVSYSDFSAMDIRTATVLQAERVPKTDKLLKLLIDTGLDQRTIVSGIAQWYSPQELVGKQICILANLEPRNIRGIESKGMILMAKQSDGKLRVVSPEEKVDNGSTVA